MPKSIMLENAKEFAVNIVNICKAIKAEKKESVLTNQLLRSGTSIGANIHESKYAHGTADFVSKMQIALKECYESEYWLELLVERGYYEDTTILDECIEVKKILISSINTAKSNNTN